MQSMNLQENSNPNIGIQDKRKTGLFDQSKGTIFTDGNRPSQDPLLNALMAEPKSDAEDGELSGDDADDADMKLYEEEELKQNEVKYCNSNWQVKEHSVSFK